MIDTRELTKTINNIVGYGTGYIETISSTQVLYMTKLSSTIIESLYGYIDSKAAMHSANLHHVYEPGMAGLPEARLFSFSGNVNGSTLTINGEFLESVESPVHGGEPFRERASIMEAGTTIHVQPRDKGYLAFMDDGELVIISSGVTVEHPGGFEVERGFAETVDEFFKSYLTKGVLAPLMQSLSTPVEFNAMFGSGAKTGYPAGKAAAQKYLERGFDEAI